MADSALIVYEAATRAGMSITPDVLVAAIRTAATECMDSTGQISLSKLYELTCELETIKL